MFSEFFFFYRRNFSAFLLLFLHICASVTMKKMLNVFKFNSFLVLRSRDVRKSETLLTPRSKYTGVVFLAQRDLECIIFTERTLKSSVISWKANGAFEVKGNLTDGRVSTFSC